MPRQICTTSWSKTDSTYSDVKLKIFKKMTTKNSERYKILQKERQISTSLCNWGVNWSLQQKSILERKAFTQCWYQDCLNTRMKNSHWLTSNVVDQPNRKICVTLQRYSVDKPESSYAQVGLFARKKEDKKCQQVANVKYKLEEFICLLDGKKSVYHKVFA